MLNGQFIRHCILFSLLMLITACNHTPEINEELLPNIVIIFTDDQGYEDVGCFGSPDILTPNLDKMATEGARLTNFYVAQAVCSASRAGLLTGCYPNRIGIHGALFPHSPVGLNHEEITIAEMLKERGYATGMYGKWHLGDHRDYLPTHHGFDEYYGIPYSNDMWPQNPSNGINYTFPPLPLISGDSIVNTIDDQSLLTTKITEKSVAFIESHKDNPFFLYVAHPMPHVPLYVSDKFTGKSERGLYGDVIMEIDWSVGEILQSLKRNGIDENTLVIFTSDNGPWLSYGNHGGSADPLREGKGTALEGGQRVPCIMRFPGKIPENISIDIPMMTIDVLPMLASLTGSNMPTNQIDGKNIWPVVSTQSRESPQEAYFFYYHQNELHGVRYENWKLYFPHRYRTLHGRPGGMDGERVNYEMDSIRNIELYNLDEDISEKINVAAQNPEIVAKIKSLADGARIIYGDELYHVTGTGYRPPASIQWNMAE